MGERVPNVISKLPGHTGPTIRVGLDTAKQLLRPRRMQVTSNGRSPSITSCGSAALSLKTVVTALVIAPDQSTIIVGATFWYSSGGATFITRLRPTTERNLCAQLVGPARPTIFSSWSFLSSAHSQAFDQHYRSIGPCCQANAGTRSAIFVFAETGFLIRG
jgi:hypothetical protein